MPFPREEVQRILAARRFSRSAARVFLLAYLTGAVLLLPGLVPAGGTGASAAARAIASDDPPIERAALLARARATVDRSEPPQARGHVVAQGETLDSIARDFGVTAETVAYNNGMHSRTELHAGATLTIPRIDAALYVVKDGDSVDSLVGRFGSDANAIMDANRLYFEPQNFSVGKTILVPTARFPDFDFDPAVARAGPLARGTQTSGTVAAPSVGRLMWPVEGVITQYFSAWHTGVDIAAPYGAALGAADAGTVSAVGWVAVGGLPVCVQHDWGIETCYFHTSAVYAAVGQRVARAQVIAAVGLTGATTGPHVHWEANRDGARVNPLAY